MSSPVYQPDPLSRGFMKSIVFRMCAFALIASGFSAPSCAQRLVEVTDPGEISVTFRHVAKSGDTKKFLIGSADIPKAPDIPSPYQSISNKSYKLVTGTIDLGDPVISFKVPLNNEEEFRQVRVLRLVVNKSPAFEWKDCTMSLESVQALEATTTNPEYLLYLQNYKKENSKYFPNFSSRQISCEIDDGLKTEEYFTIVRQLRSDTGQTFR